MENYIIVDNVKKTFKLSPKQQKLEHTLSKTKVAVNGLSFNVRKGEIYGLLGPNGAGKTTTLRMMSTLIKSESGDIIIDGASVNKEPYKVREKIGFLTSELKLEDFFTVDYMFNFYSALHNVDEKTREIRKKKLYERFGITDFCFTKVGELSTGMKQKASLAVSLVHDPDIIIFDEPTNCLDVITAKVVTDFLKELKEEGKSIIVSTHIFSLIEKICDRVGIIIDGKMVMEGTLEDLTKEKNLEDVFFDVYSSIKGEK